MDEVVSYCNQYGFIFQGSEIYGGLANTWDYGPLGTRLKNQVKDVWRYYFIQMRENSYEVDADILMNPRGDTDSRIVFNIKPALASIKINILPLIKKKHAEKAKELYIMLAKHCMVQYEESGSIGKRYRRGDAIGIPYAITVDDATLEQETVP